MNDIKDIVFKLLELNDKIQEIQNEIEKRLFKYTYLSDNNKIELDVAIKEDKDYISKMYSMLNEEKVSEYNNITISNDGVSIPSLDIMSDASLPEINEPKNALSEDVISEDNETKEESDLPKLEMIDLSPSTDNKETNEEVQIVDELAELTSSKNSTDNWVPPEVSIEPTVDIQSTMMPSIPNTEVKNEIPEAKIPDVEDYKTPDNLTGVGVSASNKFITPEFMSDGPSNLSI